MYVPPAIANIVLPLGLSQYDSVADYLYRYAAIVGQHRRHPWCRETSYSIYMALKHTHDHVCILSSTNHTVVEYADIIIDLECNSFIYNFDWMTETNPQEHTRINPEIDTASIPRRLKDYFSQRATQKFILRGEDI